MFIVDAHLDLAYNVARGRDVTQRASTQPTIGREIASVSLPELREGHVGLICATIFCQPAMPGVSGYHNSEEAHQQAQTQLDWYHRQFDAGELELVRGVGASPMRPSSDAPGRGAHATIETIILLEGGDAIRNPSDVQKFFDAGVRIVGLAWQRTRYAGGTRAPGALTDDGKSLIPHLDRVGMIHDISHLAEQSFWQLLDLTGKPVIASHSNCRAIVGGPSNRHLTDDMIKALADRAGVIGINFCDKFLVPDHEFGKRRATLNDVVAHIKHMCDLAGDCDHVGLGTDMDGGLGREQIPVEIETSADLPRVADALSSANFSDEDIGRIMSENWLRFFRESLPG